MIVEMDPQIRILQQARYIILCTLLSLIGVFERVQVWGNKWKDDVQKELLQPVMIMVVRASRK